MDSFTILSASNPQERREWLELLDSWPDREISADPGYVELFARSSALCFCAKWSDDHGTILFPLIKRPIGSEAWAVRESNRFDCASPYGYGGPFAWGKPNVERFWFNFNCWARDTGMVSLFSRLSLFTDQRIEFDGDVRFVSMNVVRLLKGASSFDIWTDYEHKVRKNVNKARRSGLSVQIEDTADQLDDFLRIYYETMARRQASTDYYFPRTFFERLVTQLPHGFKFVHCSLDERVISTELILVSNRNVYSFLGGTVPEMFELRPNDLLKHEIIEWARANNKCAFVLGGGYAPDDGIFRYKQSFAPHSNLPFYVGQRIYDQQAYDRLISQRTSWELSRSHYWEPQSSYFPAYRS